MAHKRLYKCQKCSMVYWGNELKPEARSFPIKLLRVRCPTPECRSNLFIGQATPSEVGFFYGVRVFIVAFCIMLWISKLDWFLASGVALLLSVVTMLVSWWLHRPSSVDEDQIFAANELAQFGENLYNSGRLKEARLAFERAFAILGTSIDLKLEAAIIGRLANTEKKISEFALAQKHYKIALAIAEQIDDTSGVINRLSNLAALLGDDLHNPQESIIYLERALKLARGFNDPAKLAQILLHLAKREREANYYDQALRNISEALTIAQTAVQSEIVAEAFYERACVAIAKDCKTDAILDLKRSKELTRLKDRREQIIQTLHVVEAAIRDEKFVEILPPGHTSPEDSGPDLYEDIPPDVYAALQSGLTHVGGGRLALAADCLTQALQRDCVKNCPKARAIAGMNLGDILREMGRLNNALEVLRNAIEWGREANIPYIECGILLNLGIALHSKGLWAESRSRLEEALELAKGRDDKFLHGRILLALGNLHRDSREFDIAEKYYQKADEYAHILNDIKMQGAVQISYGNLYFLKFKESRWQAAQTYDKKAVEMASHNLLLAHKHYEKALELTRQVRDAPLQGIALHMLGIIHKWLGHSDQALESLRNSISMAHSCLSKIGLAGRLNDLGTMEQKMGYLDEAKEHFKQAVEIYQKQEIASPDIAGCFENLGVLLVRMGDVFNGSRYISNATLLDNKMITEVFTIASEGSSLEFLKQAESRLYDLVSLVANGGPLQGDQSIVQNCADAVIRRKGAVLEALLAQREMAASGSHPEMAGIIQELAQVRMQLAHLILSGQGIRRDGSFIGQAFDLSERKHHIEQKISRYLPQLSIEEKLRRTDRQTVAKHLPEGSVLIEFFRFIFFPFPPLGQEAYWGPARYLAFILPAGEPDKLKMVDLGDAEPIDKMIATFRASIIGETDKHGGRFVLTSTDKFKQTGISQKGAALRHVVFDTLLPAIDNKRRLLLAPDGDLTRLPFEALTTNDGQYLIDKYYISYLSTGRDVLRFDTAPAGRPSDPIVIADPDFDLSLSTVSSDTKTEMKSGPRCHHLFNSKLHFTRLPYTRTEGKQIARMLGVQSWLGDMALEKSIKACHSPSILHLATHGFFLEDQKTEPNRMFRGLDTIICESDLGAGKLALFGKENPLLRSGLALAGANTWLEGGKLPDEAEDGILTAEDVSCLDLLDTELVVLSACETGLGEVRKGEGVFGLRRAFVLAGAKTLIMSLWKVEDQKTRELMEKYYNNMLSGQSRANALRKAQLEIKDKYSEPFYWAAFICQGNPSPLPYLKNTS